MTKTFYLAYFKDLGYYANHQPNFQWSFTDDIMKANEYTTRDGVLERLVSGAHHYKAVGEIVTVEKVTTVINREVYEGMSPSELKELKKQEKERLKAEKSREEYLKFLESEKNNKGNVT